MQFRGKNNTSIQIRKLAQEAGRAAMHAYLAVVSSPHLELLHRPYVIQLDEPVHGSRGQPIAVAVPQAAVHLLLVAVDCAVDGVC